MYREVLVYTSTGDTARRMSEYAGVFASTLKARLAGIVIDVDFVDYSTIESAITESQKASAVEILLKQRSQSHEAALRAGSLFEVKAHQRGVLCDMHYKTYVSAEIPDVVTEMARLYDCALVPSVEEVGGFEVPIIEEVIFGSGRPLIVLPIDHDVACSLGYVVVAWDGSRPATRAVHDALPILREATAVDILTITEEKLLDRLSSGQDLVRHLKAHDISARYEEVHFQWQACRRADYERGAAPRCRALGHGGVWALPSEANRFWRGDSYDFEGSAPSSTAIAIKAANNADTTQR